MKKYLITYMFTNRFGETTEIYNETYHPETRSDLVNFAQIKCNCYPGLSYKTKKL
jgi:hypothetical protein